MPTAFRIAGRQAVGTCANALVHKTRRDNTCFTSPPPCVSENHVPSAIAWPDQWECEPRRLFCRSSRKSKADDPPARADLSPPLQDGLQYAAPAGTPADRFGP